MNKVMRINAAMRGEISKALTPKSAIPVLPELISSGFLIKNGCFFLKGVYQPHYDRHEIADFHDETGFEAFVNSVDFECVPAKDQLAGSLVFCRKIMLAFQDIASTQTLLVLIGIYQVDVRAKFYVQRAGQSYLSEDIEGYKEAIMELSATGLDEILTTYCPNGKD